jgi:PAS domain S-box-containing protein
MLSLSIAVGNSSFLNSATVKLYGATSSEELIGRPVLERVHPDYQEIVKERIRQLTQEGAQVEWMEQKLLRLDGTVIDVEVAAAPFTYQGFQALKLLSVTLAIAKKQKQNSVTLWRKKENSANSNPESLPQSLTSIAPR